MTTRQSSILLRFRHPPTHANVAVQKTQRRPAELARRAQSFVVGFDPAQTLCPETCLNFRRYLISTPTLSFCERYARPFGCEDNDRVDANSASHIRSLAENITHGNVASSQAARKNAQLD